MMEIPKQREGTIRYSNSKNYAHISLYMACKKNLGRYSKPYHSPLLLLPPLTLSNIINHMKHINVLISLRIDIGTFIKIES